MTYAEPLSNQVLMFIRSIGPGVIIGLIYDVIFSFFRSLSNRRAVIIAADLMFSVVATLISFFYMVIYNSGTVRLNIILAEALGAVAFHYTMGRYISKPIEFLAVFFGRVVGFLCYPIVFLIERIKLLYMKILPKVPDRFKRKKKEGSTAKKIMNYLKIHLKISKK
jgi:hypothetical protein